MKDGFKISELQRKMANLVMFGRVIEVSAEQIKARVQIGDLKTGWLPWISQRAAVMNCWTSPAVGEQVMIVSHNGDPAQGVIVGSLHSKDNQAPSANPDLFKVVFSDGSYVEHNVKTHAMRIGSAGKVTVAADGDVSVVTAGNAKVTAVGAVEVTAAAINLTGPVTINGTLMVTGETALQATTVLGTPLVPGGDQF